jgi:hypothetical protein
MKNKIPPSERIGKEINELYKGMNFTKASSQEN